MTFPLNLAVYARDAELQSTFTRNMGAMLIGSSVAIFLSGAVSMQVFLYYQLYPKDIVRLKIIVFSVWFIDVFHSAMTIAANWQHLIKHFGQWDTIEEITWSIPVSIALTAIVTYIVHCFFIHRIFSLSRRNYHVTVPLVLLATLRLAAASVTSAKMLQMKNYPAFLEQFGYVVTLGLVTSASLDILITVGLCYFLRRGRSPLGSMDRIIDTITLYTIEDGILTCVTTAISLICWLAMPKYLVFLGLHFAISKLYANTLLATLNARKSLLNKSQGSTGDHPLPVLFPTNFSQSRRGVAGPWSQRSQVETRLQVAVEKTVHREVDGELQNEQASSRSAPDDTIDLSKSPQAAYLPV